MANAQKHAPGAAVTVSLRSADAGRRIVLEVHDDGPGFKQRLASKGTGLQNMNDRVAAVGGELAIDSRPGAGTWIHAEASVPAPWWPCGPIPAPSVRSAPRPEWWSLSRRPTPSGRSAPP